MPEKNTVSIDDLLNNSQNNNQGGNVNIDDLLNEDSELKKNQETQQASSEGFSDEEGDAGALDNSYVQLPMTTKQDATRVFNMGLDVAVMDFDRYEKFKELQKKNAIERYKNAAELGISPVISEISAQIQRSDKGYDKSEIYKQIAEATGTSIDKIRNADKIVDVATVYTPLIPTTDGVDDNILVSLPHAVDAGFIGVLEQFDNSIKAVGRVMGFDPPDSPFKKMKESLKSTQELYSPNTILSRALESAAEFTPEILMFNAGLPEIAIPVLSKATAGVVRGVPQFAQGLGMKEFVNSYQESDDFLYSAEKGSEGFNNAIVWESLGIPAKFASEIVYKSTLSKPLSALTSASVAASGFATESMIRQYIDNGSINADEVIDAMSLAVVMHGKGLFDAMTISRQQHATNAFFASPADHVLKAINTEKSAGDLRRESIDLAQKSRSEKNETKSRSILMESRMIDHYADIKSVIEDISKNGTEKYIKGIDGNKKLSEKEKTYFKDKVNSLNRKINNAAPLPTYEINGERYNSKEAFIDEVIKIKESGRDTKDITVKNDQVTSEVVDGILSGDSKGKISEIDKKLDDLGKEYESTKLDARKEEIQKESDELLLQKDALIKSTGEQKEGGTENAETIRSTQEEIRKEEGGTDLRRDGKEQKGEVVTGEEVVEGQKEKVKKEDKLAQALSDFSEKKKEINDRISKNEKINGNKELNALFKILKPSRESASYKERKRKIQDDVKNGKKGVELAADEVKELYKNEEVKNLKQAIKKSASKELGVGNKKKFHAESKAFSSTAKRLISELDRGVTDRNNTERQKRKELIDSGMSESDAKKQSSKYADEIMRINSDAKYEEEIRRAEELRAKGTKEAIAESEAIIQAANYFKNWNDLSVEQAAVLHDVMTGVSDARRAYIKDIEAENRAYREKVDGIINEELSPMLQEITGKYMADKMRRRDVFRLTNKKAKERNIPIMSKEYLKALSDTWFDINSFKKTAEGNFVINTKSPYLRAKSMLQVMAPFSSDYRKVRNISNSVGRKNVDKLLSDIASGKVKDGKEYDVVSNEYGLKGEELQNTIKDVISGRYDVNAKSKLVEEFGVVENAANALSVYKLSHKEKLIDGIADVLGIEKGKKNTWNNVNRKLTSVLSDETSITIDGQVYKVPKGVLINTWLQLRNENTREMAMKNNGMTEAEIKAVDEKLSDVDRKIGLEFIKITDEIEPLIVKEAANQGVKFSSVSNYWTRSVKENEYAKDLSDQLMYESSNGSSRAVSMMQERLNHSHKLSLTDHNVMNVFDKYLNETGQFLHNREAENFLLALRRNEAFNDILKKTGYKRNFEALTAHALGYNKFGRAEGFYNVVNKFLGGYQRNALAFKAAQIPKQATSYMAGLEEFSRLPSMEGKSVVEISYEFHKEILKNPNIAKARDEMVLKSSKLDSRMKSMFRDMHIDFDASSSEFTKARSNLANRYNNLSLATTRIGDMDGIILGYYPVYKRALADGLSKEEALRRFEEYDNTQQSQSMINKTEMQLNPHSRFFVAFQSSQIGYFNKVFEAQNKMAQDYYENRSKYKGAKGRIEFYKNNKRNMYKVIMYRQVLNTMFNMVSGLPATLLNKSDDDKWKKYLGNLAFINILGNSTINPYIRIIGGQGAHAFVQYGLKLPHQTYTEDAMMYELPEEIMNDFDGFMKAVKDDDEKKAFEHALNGVITAGSIVTPLKAGAEVLEGGTMALDGFINGWENDWEKRESVRKVLRTGGKEDKPKEGDTYWD